MMNKSGIPWCDFSWNPITGCKKKCNDCFAHKIAKRLSGSIRINIGSSDIQKDLKNRLFVLEKPFHSERGTVSLFPAGFDPTFHRYRLGMISYKQKPANIFVGSIGDMFDASVPTEWITEVFEACKKASWHNYLFMTCNPERYTELADQELLPTGDNFWYGSRIDYNQDVFCREGYHTFIWIEPIERYVIPDELPQSEWIIIGCQPLLPSKRNIADKEHIQQFISKVGDVPLFMKSDDNMKAVWKDKLICEYPILLKRPPDKPIPHCNECKHCHKLQEGKRGIRHTCTHRKILSKHKETGGLHIDGRYARTSPPWCPRR